MKKETQKVKDSIKGLIKKLEKQSEEITKVIEVKTAPRVESS